MLATSARYKRLAYLQLFLMYFGLNTAVFGPPGGRSGQWCHNFLVGRRSVLEASLKPLLRPYPIFFD